MDINNSKIEDKKKITNLNVFSGDDISIARKRNPFFPVLSIIVIILILIFGFFFWILSDGSFTTLFGSPMVTMFLLASSLAMGLVLLWRLVYRVFLTLASFKKPTNEVNENISKTKLNAQIDTFHSHTFLIVAILSVLGFIIYFGKIFRDIFLIFTY